jgi:peptide-methionine (S)-S-oxide reductase
MRATTFFLRLFLASEGPKGSSSDEERAIFAGGCFWCMQPAFDKLKGVLSTSVGYIGGDDKKPTYKKVSTGKTGHLEAIEIIYNPSKVSYSELLDAFWHNVDPTDMEGQFCDKGSQYLSAIFYLTDEQKKLAETSKEELIKSGKVPAVHTKILPAKTFHPAEEEHQEYAKKNPMRYKFYTVNSGREKRLKDLWGK